MIDYLCIGAHKAGSSWLHEQLARHPQVWSPIYKELHFFDEYENKKITVEKTKRLRWLRNYFLSQLRGIDDGKRIDVDELSWAVNFVQTPYEKRTLDWYAGLFQFGREHSKIVGETTPAYAILSEDTLKEIFSFNKKIKIIYILRNPIWRAWSSVRFDLFTKKLLVASDPSTTVKKQDILLRNPIWRAWSSVRFNLFTKKQLVASDPSTAVKKQDILEYLGTEGVMQRGDYLTTIKKLNNVFPTNCVKYMFYEDIGLDPYGFMQIICDHLNIEYSKNHFPTIQEKSLVSVKRKIDADVYSHLRDLYAPMVREIHHGFFEIHPSWKEDFDVSPAQSGR